MRDITWIEKTAREKQTSRDNVAREYCQHLFLSKFYQQEGVERILFKGGTALRILWNSPRFSEDLDFSGKMAQGEIENRIQDTLLEIQREGITTDIAESKKTSGGYLGRLLFQWMGLSVSIQIEISQRQKGLGGGYEQSLIQNDFVPSYTLLHLPETAIIEEKIAALLARSKPRDFFDLYFILRSSLNFKGVFRKDKRLKTKILEKLRATGVHFSGELKQFLPASHHSLLKNFPDVLEREIRRALA